jgi:glycosyltransferase involved in cell wall biosynthesis
MEIILLDPSGSEEADSSISENVRAVSWKSSPVELFFRRIGLQSTSEILGVVFTTERLIDFLAGRGINVLRSVMHDRTALYGLIAARAVQVPYIIEVAGNYELMQRLLRFTYYFGNFYRFRWLRAPVKALSNWLLGLPLRGASRVIGRNKNNYEHAFALGVNVDRLSLVRIRISKGFFDQSRFDVESFIRPASYRYLLYVARLAPEKRPLDCFDIFETIAAEIDDVHLVMIGDGPLMSSVQRRRETSSCADRVHVLGALPNSDVVAWTKYAAIGLELYSGSSLVEKMSCGVPVVAYDIEWMSEVVIDGYTGYTADFLDTAGMAARCIALLENPEAASEMGKRAQILAEKLFDRNAIIEREDSYLRKAVAHRSLRAEI